MSDPDLPVLPSFAAATIAEEQGRDLRVARGLLLAIVGPSGVGKDSLIAGAARALENDSRFSFARRVVTRPAEAGGEPHLPMDASVFETLRAAGAFALAWSAHGISYGIPTALCDVIAAGQIVIANLSRTKLHEAPSSLGPTIAIEVTAPAAVLRQRLLVRGREDAKDIEARLARQVVLPDTIRHIEFVNDAPLPQAIGDFTALLQRVAAEREAAQ